MIGAVLVVYKPDLALTERLLTRLYGQTEEVVIVDNSPTPHDFTKVIKHYHYIHLADNSGIAHAHNAGLLYLLKAILGSLLLPIKNNIFKKTLNINGIDINIKKGKRFFLLLLDLLFPLDFLYAFR